MDGLERRGELLDRGLRQRAQHRHLLQEVDVVVAHAHAGVEPAQRRPGEEHDHGGDEPERDAGAADPERLDGRDRDRRARGHAQRQARAS